MRMDLGMRSTSHYDSMPCMTVASLEMSDEPKKMALKTKMQAPEAPKTGSGRAKSGVIAKYYTSRRIFFTFSLHNSKCRSTFAVYY